MLYDQTILITREAKQAQAFSEMVLQYGGTPVEVPLLKIACTERDGDKSILQKLSNYQWIFFTSSNGVDCFMQLAMKQQISMTKLKQKKYAVVGHKTEKALNKYELNTAFIPTVYNADHMADEFLAQYPEAGPLLLVRGNRSRDILPNRFSEHGVSFDIIEVYASEYNEQAAAALKAAFAAHRFDFLTFTSPSTVDAFLEAKGADLATDGAICVCIGTTTEQRAREAGFRHLLTPEQFTIEGMLLCMQHHALKKG